MSDGGDASQPAGSGAAAFAAMRAGRSAPVRRTCRFVRVEAVTVATLRLL